MKNQFSHKAIGVSLFVLCLAYFSCKKSDTSQTSPPIVQTKDSIVTIKTPVLLDSLHLADTLAKLKELQFLSGNTLIPLSQALLYSVADSLQGIEYDRNKIQDCSGMFRRYLGKLREATHPDFRISDPDWDIPEPGLANSEYSNSIKAYSKTLPRGQDVVRNTKQFGNWYWELGQFVPVRPGDVEKRVYRDMIKPGMVMFYARKPLTEKARYSPKDLTIINHMGVVVKVERDSEGDILRYHLFHGRFNGNPSKITGGDEDLSTMYHERDYSSRGAGSKAIKYPSLGFADQHWIGIAPITSNLGRYEITQDTITVPL